MTKKEFLERFNYAPYDIFEIAEVIGNGLDDPQVSNTAKELLKAKEQLIKCLTKIGFEFG